VVEYLPSIDKALGLIPAQREREKKKDLVMLEE
jgi:hypothetical protein